MAPCLTFQAVLSLKREVLDHCRAKVNKMRVIRGAFRKQSLKSMAIIKRELLRVVWLMNLIESRYAN